MATAIPASWKLPLFLATMDSSGANRAIAGAKPTLLVGQILASGTGVVDVLYQVSRPAEVAELFGAGSMLHRQALAYFAADPLAEVWVYGIADGTGAYATGKITITGTATEDGVLHLEIGGQALDISVSTDDTANDVGAAVALALTTHAVAPTDYPVSAGNVAGVLTLTCKWKGTSGNDIMLALNPKGPRGRQYTPAGLTVVITSAMGKTPMTPGAGGGVIDNFAANAAAFDLDHLVLGGADFDDTLGQLQVDFNDGDAGRWGYIRMQYGHVWAALTGTYAELSTDKLTTYAFNSQHTSVVPLEGDYTTPAPKCPFTPWEAAAAYAGICARSLRIDPAAPCHGQAFTSTTDGKLSFRAPEMVNRWSASTRNALVTAGFATMRYDGTSIRVEYEATCYTENEAGSPDSSYADVQVLAISQKWLRECRSMIETNYAQAKMNDPTFKAIKGDIISKAGELQALGIFKNVDAFADSLEVTEDPENDRRCLILADPEYVKALRQAALINAFR